METIETLGKYEIKRPLGRGAMGTVYEGWDPIIARRVAIKTVKLPDAADPETEEALARFRREAQAAGRLTHPNIVGVFDYGETNDFAYIVMEFVDGPPLKTLLDKHERFALADTMRVMENLLAGLQFSHERGVVHRDIKPANVMLTSEGQAKIADFGIARIESSSMTQAGTLLGTPAYMSPEQFMGQVVDARSDIYSSGVLLYQLLTGERPFEGGMSAIMHKALNTEPPAPSQLSVTAPPSFDAVVRRAMAKRPEDRFPSAKAFFDAMRAAAANPAEAQVGEDEATMVAAPPLVSKAPTRVTPAVPSTPMPAAPPAQRSNLPIVAGAAAVILLLLGGGGWWFLLRTPEPSPVVSQGTSIPSQSAATPSTTGQKPVEAPKPEILEVKGPTPQLPAVIASTPTQTPAPATTPTPQLAMVVPQPQPPPPPVVQAPLAPSVVPPIQQPPAAVTQVPVQQPPPAAVTQVPVLPPSPPPIVQPSVQQPPPPAVVQQNPPVTPPSVVQPPQQLAAVNPGVLRREIADWANSRPCTVLGGDVGDGGSVTLNGLANSGSVEDLRQGLTSLTSPGSINWRVTGVNPVFCAALNALRPVTASFGLPGASRLGLQMAEGKTQLHDGDPVRLRLVMPDFPARLRVDYISHDGNVQHLYPQLADPKDGIVADPPRLFGPGEAVNLGNPAWSVSEPYGTDMVIAVASSEPLFDRARPANAETANSYLRDLQSAIDNLRQRGVRVTGAVVTLEALPK